MIYNLYVYSIMYYSVLCSRNISSLLDCYIWIYVLLFHYILIYYTTHSDKIYKITSLSCKHVFWKTIRDVIIIIIIIITIITIIILIIIFICCRPQRRWPGTATIFPGLLNWAAAGSTAAVYSWVACSNFERSPRLGVWGDWEVMGWNHWPIEEWL